MIERGRSLLDCREGTRAFGAEKFPDAQFKTQEQKIWKTMMVEKADLGRRNDEEDD